MTYHAAHAFDTLADRKVVHGKVAMAKLYASEMAGRVADRAVQIFGGRGYMHDTAAARFYRELRVDRIWEGTSEIQRLIIARGLEKRGADAVPRLGVSGGRASRARSAEQLAERWLVPDAGTRVRCPPWRRRVRQNQVAARSATPKVPDRVVLVAGHRLAAGEVVERRRVPTRLERLARHRRSPRRSRRPRRRGGTPPRPPSRRPRTAARPLLPTASTVVPASSAKAVLFVPGSTNDERAGRRLDGSRRRSRTARDRGARRRAPRRLRPPRARASGGRRRSPAVHACDPNAVMPR